MISPEKQIFKCFGCNEGGDIFTFVMKMENWEFREALEMLAQKAGVKLEHRKHAGAEWKADKKSRLFKVNALAAQVYHQVLMTHASGKAALEYLKKRQISEKNHQGIYDWLRPLESRPWKTYLLKKGFYRGGIAKCR